VLSPTRELSGQILNSFRTYGRHVGINAALAIGGVSMGAQVRSLLNGVDVLVATPGRLLDLVGSNALRLGDVAHLVLDEADRMLWVSSTTFARLSQSFLHIDRRYSSPQRCRAQSLSSPTRCCATQPRWRSRRFHPLSTLSNSELCE
jgi:DEAD/DEAH box helicase